MLVSLALAAGSLVCQRDRGSRLEDAHRHVRPVDHVARHGVPSCVRAPWSGDVVLPVVVVHAVNWIVDHSRGVVHRARGIAHVELRRICMAASATVARVMAAVVARATRREATVRALARGWGGAVRLCRHGPQQQQQQHQWNHFGRA